MNRRTLFQAAAAAPLLATLPAAAQPAPAAQAPGFYRFKVGSTVVTMLQDGFAPRQNPTQGMAVNAAPAAVEQALREAMLPTDMLPNQFNVTIIQTPRGTIAFDTGTGGGQLAPTSGLLGQNMAAAGIDPASVNLVLVSHFHADHITGLTTRDNGVVFSNAEVAVPAVEWAFWNDDSNSGKVPEMQRGTFPNVKRRFGPYQARIRQFQWDTEVAPGIRAIAAPGHTPGHTVFHLADGRDQLFIMADTSSRPEIFLRNPGWHSNFDIDGPMASESRRRLFGRVAAERARMTAYHFPFPSNGYISTAGEGFRFHPAEWSAAI